MQRDIDALTQARHFFRILQQRLLEVLKTGTPEAIAAVRAVFTAAEVRVSAAKARLSAAEAEVKVNTLQELIERARPGISKLELQSELEAAKRPKF